MIVDPRPTENVTLDVQPVYAAARAKDIDRYLSALLAPAEFQNALMAVAAFSGEAASIPQTISDPTLAQIRLQWWHDAIEQMQGNARTGNPVADVLGETLKSKPELFGIAQEIISARASLCWIECQNPIDEIMTVSAKAESATFRLAAQIAAVEGLPEQLFDAAGVAYGTVRAAMNLPYYASCGRFELAPNAEWQLILKAHYERARMQMELFRDGTQPLPTSATKAVFLPLALVEPYLRALERQRHDALRQPAEISPLKRISRLAWTRWRGHI